MDWIKRYVGFHRMSETPIPRHLPTPSVVLAGCCVRMLHSDFRPCLHWQFPQPFLHKSKISPLLSRNDLGLIENCIVLAKERNILHTNLLEHFKSNCSALFEKYGAINAIAYAAKNRSRLASTKI